jgi:hypothetical protein
MILEPVDNLPGGTLVEPSRSSSSGPIEIGFASKSSLNPARCVWFARTRYSDDLGAPIQIPKGEPMPMTAGQRTISMLSLGALLLSTPGRASLEKITISPHLPSMHMVALKSRMIASWYGQKFQGRLTASGEVFDLHKLTAAHKTLPLGSLVQLKVKSTGKTVVVRINDRGPWIKGRDFDLSEAAAEELGIHKNGIAAVEAALIQPEVVSPVVARTR